MKTLTDISRKQVACLILCSLTTLLLAQQWGMMLSNSDDGWLIRSNWSEIQAFAESQKRFWMLVMNYITRIPYQVGGWPLANSAKIFINGATLFSFFLFLRQLINTSYALICCLIWLALSDVTNGYYSPFHGYLLMFNLPMCCLFLSLWWYTRILDHSKQSKIIIGPFIIFGFSLFAYEPMMFFGTCFPAIYLLRKIEEKFDSKFLLCDLYTAKKFIHQIIIWMKSVIPLFLVVILFVFTYFYYRLINNSAAGGLLSIGEDWTLVLKTIFRFTMYGFRLELKSPHGYIESIQFHYSVALGLMYGILAAIAIWLILPETSNTTRERLLQSPISIVLISLIALSLNLLHGMTEGYRQWAMTNPYYIGNYLSSFPLAMLAASVTTFLVGGSKMASEKTLALIVTALLANSAASNMMKWSDFSSKNKADASLWTAYINDLKKETKDINERKLIICSFHSPEKVSGDDLFWSYQLTKDLKRPIEYHSKHFSKIPCDKTIDFNAYRDNN